MNLNGFALIESSHHIHAWLIKSPRNHQLTGQWWHAGFHLTTAIVGPTILTLPYAFRGLGWGLGFLGLTTMGVVTFYSYFLMSKVLDYCEKSGRRHIRFRELAADVLGD